MKTNNIFSVKNKNIILTGASRGIGFYLLKELKNNGANILGLARSKKLGSRNLEKNYNSCDINEYEKFKKICSNFSKKFGKIDVLINNAGISLQNKKDIDGIKNFEKTINTNLVSVFKCCFATSKFMANNSSIINISSIAALMGFSDNPGYISSKGGLHSLTNSLAFDLAKKKIRVNSIMPGYIKTNMTINSFKNKEKFKSRMQRIPLLRWGNSSDLLGAVIFLSSSASSYITGTKIIVDGGFSIKGI